MRTCRIVKPGRAEIAEIEEAGHRAEETTIDVKHIGLCGTDLRTFTGDNPIVQYPRVIGHEIGALLSQDSAIDGVTYPKGTVVALNPYTTCGKCPACRNDRSNACMHNETLGNQRDGAGREQFQISPRKLYPLQGLNTRVAACIEPLSVGFHAAKRGQVSQGDLVVVLGTGVIGLGAVAGATYQGAEVVAVDLDERKLALARRLGASRAVNANVESVENIIAEMTDGEGAAVTIEAIGLPSTYRQAVDIVAFTGRVILIGYTKEDVAFTTKLFVAKELDIRGSRNAQEEDFHEVIAAVQSGKLPAEDIVTQIYPMEEIQAALTFWRDNPLEVTKLLLEV